MKNRNIPISWLMLFVFLVGLFSFVIVPFSGDVEVFLGSSRLAEYFGKGLVYNSFNAWEIKGVFLRLLFSAGYSLVKLFASCPSMSFSLILSLLYAVVVIAFSWFIAYTAISDKNDRFFFVSLFCTAFFAVSSWCKMQAEMTCTLLLFVSLALAVKADDHSFLRLIISGILISFLFWFKVPLLLLSVSFAASILLLSKENLKNSGKKIFVVAVGAFASLLLVGIFVYFINPDEYLRMLMTSIYQNTLLSGNEFSIVSVIKHFTAGFAKAMVSIPVLYIGTACLIINFVKIIQKKEYVKVICHLIMWIIPMLYVMLSNCYFTYHYLTFMFAAMIEIWISLDRKLSAFKNKCFRFSELVVWGGVFVFYLILSYAAKSIVFYKHIDVVLVFIGTLLLVVLFGVCFIGNNCRECVIKKICGYVFLIYFTYSSLFSSNSIAYIEFKHSSYNNDFSLPLGENEKLLYLDAGVGAYYLGYDTYYEEYYPLILQRIDENSERSKLQRYVEASEKILSYSGNYICLTEDFIFLDGKNPTLKKKIQSEYELYRRYNIYVSPMSIFSLKTEADMQQLDIYKRKRF